ncbi:hypothetical protein ACEE21_15120, partial [Clostridium baratii]
MEKTLLLSSILQYLALGKSVSKVQYDCENGIEICLRSAENVKYFNSILSKDTVIYSDNDVSSIKHCIDSYKMFLLRYPNNILIIREGIDLDKNEVVYIKVETVKNNLDSLLLRLCREFDTVNRVLGIKSEDIGEYVYDSNEYYIDIYALNINMEDSEEEVTVQVIDKEVICDELYDKVPLFKTIFNEGLLKCIWSLVGDYDIVVRLLKCDGKYYPSMYCLYLDSN